MFTDWTRGDSACTRALKVARTHRGGRQSPAGVQGFHQWLNQLLMLHVCSHTWHKSPAGRRKYSTPPCVDLAQENEAHMRLNGSFIWESQLPDWAGTDSHQPALCTNVTVNVSKGPQTCLWNWVIHFSVFGSSLVDQKHMLIAVFYIHTTR